MPVITAHRSSVATVLRSRSWRTSTGNARILARAAPTCTDAAKPSKGAKAAQFPDANTKKRRQKKSMTIDLPYRDKVHVTDRIVCTRKKHSTAEKNASRSLPVPPAVDGAAGAPVAIAKAFSCAGCWWSCPPRWQHWAPQSPQPRVCEPISCQERRDRRAVVWCEVR